MEEAKAALEKIDKVMEGYMIREENKCRKLYSNHYKFSPTVKLWLDRCHSYRALIWLKNKLKELNTTNLKQLSSNKLYMRYKSYKEQTRRLMAQSPRMRKRFLLEKLTELINRKKTEEAKKIKDVLNSKARRKQWQGVQQVTTPQKTRMITYIDVPQPNGTTVRCNTKLAVERANGQEIKTRFVRAGAHQYAKERYSGCLVTRLTQTLP